MWDINQLWAEEEIEEEEKEDEAQLAPEFDICDFEGGGCEALESLTVLSGEDAVDQYLFSPQAIPQPPFQTFNPPSTPKILNLQVLLDTRKEVRTLVSNLGKQQITPLSLQMLWKDEVQKTMLEIQQLTVQKTTERLTDVQNTLNLKIFYFRENIEKITSSAGRDLA